ncbi:MAG TPA: phage virion morphogenesis protein [Alicycliphilus sp.]|nr:phage virion morphogenesis protein [Alicycliphilus sp.]
MAGTHLSINAVGLDSLRQRLQVMAGLDTSTLLPRLGEYLLTSTQDRFSSQTDPEGSPWEALKPRTIKRKKYNAAKILTERGFLRKNLRYQVLNKTTVQVGSNLEYAATHQYGRGNIPARPFLGLSPQDHQEIRTIIADWAAEQGFK